MSSARARTRTAWSGDEHANYATTAPPTPDICLSSKAMVYLGYLRRYFGNYTFSEYFIDSLLQVNESSSPSSILMAPSGE